MGNHILPKVKLINVSVLSGLDMIIKNRSSRSVSCVSEEDGRGSYAPPTSGVLLLVDVNGHRGNRGRCGGGASGLRHTLRVAASRLVQFEGQGAGRESLFELLDGAVDPTAAGDQLVLSDGQTDNMMSASAFTDI